MSSSLDQSECDFRCTQITNCPLFPARVGSPMSKHTFGSFAAAVSISGDSMIMLMPYGILWPVAVVNLFFKANYCVVSFTVGSVLPCKMIVGQAAAVVANVRGLVCWYIVGLVAGVPLMSAAIPNCNGGLIA